jgi:hypothetical protein
MDQKSRDWPTVQLAKKLLANPATANLTPSQFVAAAEQLGYVLVDPAKDRPHLANDWGNENHHGWFGDILSNIVLPKFKEALDHVKQGGPYLDMWWVHGGLPAGSDPAIQCHVEPPNLTGVVGLFVVTVPIDPKNWPYPPPPGHPLTILQTK